MQNKIRAYVVILSNPNELVADERRIVSVDKESEIGCQVIGNSSFKKVGEIYRIPIYQIDPKELRRLIKHTENECQLCGTKYADRAQCCHQCGASR